MKTVTITIDDETADRLEAMADIIENELADFITNEVIPVYVEMNEGSVSENLAARVYDTLEEAQRSALKSNALAGTESDWPFYRRPDGRISAECNRHFHADRIAEGCMLIEKTESARQQLVEK
ncbi:MAG TPA: hypothetical protein PLS03_11065 [Terrimicrobiaceae bacterium]|nr:hypothetical protein [Terrimicrobiaceae bacterium]